MAPRVTAALFVCLVLPCYLISLVQGTIAHPEPQVYRAEDGTELKLKLKGDGFHHWLEDQNGHAVVKDGEEYYYAHGIDTEGELVHSGEKVKDHQLDPSSVGIPKVNKLRGRPRRGQKRRSKRRALSLAPGAGEARRGGVAAAAAAGEGRRGRKLTVATTGTLRNLVVPIMFADHVNRTVPTRAELELLWNADRGHPSYYGSTNASVRSFFAAQSYNYLDLNTTVGPWVVVSGSESHYCGGVSGPGSDNWMELLREALNLTDAHVDFSDFDQDGDGYIDAIAFMHSGYGAEYGGYDSYGTYYDDRVWSHKWLIFDDDNYYYDPWVGAEGVYVEDYHIESALAGVSGGNVSAIGVPAHETAHFLGLPDLYDTDYSSSGIDTWGLMANSWGWDYTGELPPSLSAWSKVELGWDAPKELNSTVFNNSNTVTVKLSEIHDPWGRNEEDSDWYSSWWAELNTYLIKVAFPYTPGEYLLLEYRMALLNDRDQPADGLLVWHIDETVENNDDEGYYGDGTFPASHYQVALIQADGAFDLEQGYSGDSGDVFIEGDRLFNSLEVHPSSMGYLGGVGYTSGIAIAVFKEGEWAESWTYYSSWDYDNFLRLNISFTNETSTANATATIDGSCQDSCGGTGSNGTASCWCDSSCSFWGDCCDDFDDHCDYGSSTASPTPDEDVFCSDDNDCGSDEYCYCSGEEEEARRRRKLRANGSKGGSTKSGRSGRKASSTSAAKKGRHSGNSGGFGGHSSAKTHHHAGKRSLLFTADSCYCVDNA